MFTASGSESESINVGVRTLTCELLPCEADQTNNKQTRLWSTAAYLISGKHYEGCSQSPVISTDDFTVYIVVKLLVKMSFSPTTRLNLLNPYSRAWKLNIT